MVPSTRPAALSVDVLSVGVTAYIMVGLDLVIVASAFCVHICVPMRPIRRSDDGDCLGMRPRKLFVDAAQDKDGGIVARNS